MWFIGLWLYVRQKSRNKTSTEWLLGIEFLKLKNCLKRKRVEIPQFRNFRHNTTKMHNYGTAEIGRDKNWQMYMGFILSNPTFLWSRFTDTEMLTDYSVLQKPSLFSCKKCGILSISAWIKWLSIHPLNEAICLEWDLNCRLKYPHFVFADRLAIQIAVSSWEIVVQLGELSMLFHLPNGRHLHFLSYTDL